MCGIAGFLGQYSRETALAMRERIAHRGPDSQGLYFDGAAGIALGHRRLSIVDLSETGSQPMDDQSGRYVICYNGEVYNFLDLRAELEATGHQFRGRSDTEVVLELFARSGTASFARLNGIFALAIWDKRDHILTIARDGVGTKPLYLTRTAQGLAFASELKALLALPDLDKRLDHEAVSAYISYLWSPGERTMFKAVRKLRPGSWLSIGPDQNEASGQFYTMPKPAPDFTLSDLGLIGRTGEMLAGAVERQMITDVEVGAFLSGGLDSSAIVAFARHQSPSDQAMQCFTIDYDQTAGEAPELEADLPYAERVADHLGVRLHKVAVDSRIAYEFEQLVYMLDEPQADPAALNNLMISALARQNGIKVLLSGTGGDDLFTGYRRHLAAGYDGIWDKVPAVARRSIAAVARNILPATGRARRVRKLLEGIDRSPAERAIGYFEWLSAERACALIHADFRPLPSDTRLPMYTTLAALGDATALDRVMWLDQHHFLADHNLNYTDKTGMARGVEIRVPFLDREMIAWAAQVPDSAKMRGGVTKWVLRKAMEPYLPYDVIYRPKAGFGVPLRSWLRNELRPMLEDLLSPETLAKRGLFDISAVSRLRQNTMSGREDGSYSLLALMAIELWCRQFVDTSDGGTNHALSGA
ncbi:MAG: asparagine synthase (glutamine-hydrolyzing) [Pseudomonadota bacterium]